MWNVSAYWHGKRPADAYVYRYVPLHRAIQIFESRALPLLKTTSWWDPLETAWTLQTYQREARLAKKTVYGSCWTTGARNDALWQIYARTAPAIRLRARLSSLESAITSSRELRAGKVYFGTVEYLKDSDIDALALELKKATQAKDVGSHLVRGLMTKRLAFAFESEIRILWVVSGARRKSAVTTRVDPASLFDQVRIDPRLEPDVADAIAQALRRISGLSDVKQSSLRDPPIALARVRKTRRRPQRGKASRSNTFSQPESEGDGA